MTTLGPIRPRPAAGARNRAAGTPAPRASGRFWRPSLGLAMRAPSTVSTSSTLPPRTPPSTTTTNNWPGPEPAAARMRSSGGRQCSVLVAATAQFSWPPVFSSQCPLTLFLAGGDHLPSARRRAVVSPSHIASGQHVLQVGYPPERSTGSPWRCGAGPPQAAQRRRGHATAKVPTTSTSGWSAAAGAGARRVAKRPHR